MDKKLKTILLLIFLSFSSTVIAQTSDNQEVERQIKELMKAREEMFKSLLNDSGFDNFDKHFEDLVKRFEKESLVTSPDLEAGDVVGEYDWRETATHQVLALKIKQIKNKPLDIKIEKGQIKLKGDVEAVDSNPKMKRVSKVHFERIFSIPSGVDQNAPEFENTAGELLIKFKKLKASKAGSKILKNVESLDQRQPVGPDADDVSI